MINRFPFRNASAADGSQKEGPRPVFEDMDKREVIVNGLLI